MVEAQSITSPLSDIKSRPLYGVLRPVPTAGRNVVVAEGVGIRSVLRLVRDAPDGFAERTHVLYSDTGSGDAHDLDGLRALDVAAIDVVPDSRQAFELLERLLDSATMGTRLYTAGSESFVGQVVRHAVEHHVDHRSVITELNGSLARRVQCVHCKHTTEDVTTSIFDCPGCGVALFVRDHYSRRLAAFQGVSANAEDPGTHPTGDEVYR